MTPGNLHLGFGLITTAATTLRKERPHCEFARL
jgi:hypothetical protein